MLPRPPDADEPGAVHDQRRARPSGRSAITVALAIVGVLAGAALFISGFTLGQLRASSPGTSADRQAQFQPFWDAYNKISSEYVGEVDQHKLVEGAIGGLFDALGDPFSSYMSSEDFRNSLSGISGQFEGIGAEMATRDQAGKEGCTPLGEGCKLVVSHLVANAPAAQAGIVEGDVLKAVDGTTVDGSVVEDVIKRVRGPKGTVVKLTLERIGSADPIELSITRAVIDREAVTSSVLADGTVGYLHIDGFSSSAAGDLKDQLRELVETRKVKKLVLDLRGDPGGFVDAARTIASQFIGSGPIYWEEFANGTKQPTEAEPGGVATDPSIRIAVLVDRGSASASEIVAGALKDTARATLVGEKTYGKGTIQQWQELGDYGGFRLSTAKWLTPKQTWIHGTGIEPDVPVTAPPNAPAGKDAVLDRALEVLGATGTGRRVAPGLATAA